MWPKRSQSSLRRRPKGPTFAEYGLHLSLNRQSDVYERKGIDLDVSTRADCAGAAAATLMPLIE